MKAAKRKHAEEYEKSKKGQNWKDVAASAPTRKERDSDLIEPAGAKPRDYFRICHRKKSNLCIAVDWK
jgi:hypothetical protein